MFKHALVAVAMLVLPSTVLAGPYEDGKSAYVEGDYEKALTLFKAAAEGGHAEAQLLLGFLHYNGEGVAQNYGTAFRWFRKAADQGDVRSQAQLGVMYENGQGVPQDFGAAASWYSKAADLGYGLAQNSLGLMYAIGQGVKQDYERAHMWLNLAAAQQFKGAQEHRDEVARRMTTDQVEQAQRMAREWLLKQSQ